MEKGRFIITGMNCSACSARIKKVLSLVEGVEEVNINLLLNYMDVVHSSKIKNEEIIKKVKSIGFGCSLDINHQEQTLTRSKSEKRRLLLSLFFLIPLFIYSLLFMNFPNLDLNPFIYGFISMVLASIIILINKHVVLKGLKGILKFAFNMESLIFLACLISYTYSIVICILMLCSTQKEIIDNYSMKLNFETSGMVLGIMSIGKYIESIARYKSTSFLTSLISLSPTFATLYLNNKEEKVKIDDVKVDDLLLVKPGEIIPVDGEIVSGSSFVDQSSLSGESLPVEKSINSQVFCGTINTDGYLIIKAKKVGKDMIFSQLITTIQDANMSKVSTTFLADKISSIFIPIMISISIIVFSLWFFVGQDFIAQLGYERLSFSLEKGISILTIACPCALSLATPVAVLVANGIGAKEGIVFKNNNALEKLSKCRTLILDKTGTITYGSLKVTKIVSNDIPKTLQIAISLEKFSEHPIAKAIRQYGEENNIEFEQVRGLEIIPGYGIQGYINNKKALVGSTNFIKKFLCVNTTLESKEISTEYSKVYVCLDKFVLGIIYLEDKIKEDSYKTIKRFKEEGFKVVLLTGDNKSIAMRTAKEVGIDEVYYEKDPLEKREVIESLKQSSKVIMVGDGINDGPSLSISDVSMGLKSGSDLALDSSDIILMNSKLSDAHKAFHIAKRCRYIIIENLFWAFFYNILMLIIASGALFSIGVIHFKPWYGAITMSISSLTVILNALRLNVIYKKGGHKIETNNK